MKKFDNYWWLRTTCIIVWLCVAFLMFSTAKLYSSTIGRTNVEIAKQKEDNEEQRVQEVYINNYSITVINLPQPQKILSLEDAAGKIKDAASVWNKNYDLRSAEDLARKIQSAAENNDLSFNLGLAIVHIESDFKSTARSSCGAVGLCQVMPNCLDEYNDKNTHHNYYTMEEMTDPEKNLEVGFWYYNRIATHYNDCYNYITKTNEATEFRDCYIAYNYGVTAFYNIQREGRQELRNGRYPEDKYNSKKGDLYSPISRLNEISQIYL